MPAPTDPVGAGDSTTAGIIAALCAGASYAEAGLIGNLIASITVQQLGATGTASPEQVRERYNGLSDLVIK
ncbi:MAG: PfkB family carbohydrate kinase [Candidatus Latescibacteria bacterium]|nr:PfkB family carbohydrate kinase [Candidatus Latescibacterota bacterium]